jgi:hypothetical protein
VCAWAVSAGPAAPDAALGCRSVGVGYTLIVPPVNGHPVRWSGAAAVPYKTRTNAAYPEALQDIQNALASVSAETGVTFTYLGNDDSLVPSLQWGAHGEPLLIGWVTAAESDLFSGAPAGVVGVAGSWYNNSGNFVSGRVALERNRLAGYPRTGPSSKMTVLLHELGHAVGLGHVNDTNQLMNPYVVPRGSWGAGDQLGLDAVSPPPGAPAMQATESQEAADLRPGPLVFD